MREYEDMALDDLLDSDDMEVAVGSSDYGDYFHDDYVFVTLTLIFHRRAQYKHLFIKLILCQTFVL